MKLLNLNLDFRYPTRYFLKNPNFAQRMWRLRRGIYELKPDFLTFQEVTDFLILGDLKAMLFHPYSFITKGIIRVRGGLVTGFDYTKWRFIYRKFIPFANQGKLFSKEMADRLLKKGILLTVFDRLQTNERIVIINVHFTANYGHKESEEERKVLRLQLVQLKNLLNDKKHIGRITIATGDFNADFTSPIIQEWIKVVNGKLLFMKNQCTICPSFNPLCHKDQTKDMQVDNIMYFGPPQQIIAKRVFCQKEEFVSDHCGQIAAI